MLFYPSKSKLLAVKYQLFIYLTIFALFFVKAIVFLDPDFGWRLRAGEIYLTQGIPKDDPFTYTMPSFPWVDHAWLQSALFYSLYQSAGYIGLSFLYAFFTLSAVAVSSLTIRKYIKYKGILKNIGVFASFPLLLTTSILFSFSGVRVQVLSWFLISVFIYLLFDKKNWIKYKFLLLPFFIIWANLHGSFALGIATVWGFLTLRSIREKKIVLSDIIVAVALPLVTLINPHGLGVWREVWSSASDAKLRFAIIEWMPALTMFDFAMASLIGISLGFVYKYRKKYFLEEKGLYLVFLLQAITSRRHLPLWSIVALPITVKGIALLLKDAQKVKYGVKRFRVLYRVAWFASLVIFVVQAIFSFQEAVYVGFYGDFYPTKAVSYLQANLPTGEIFSQYGWGGYLIWRLQDKKVFIDGRMPSWKWNAPSQKELSSAFETYDDISRGKLDYKEVFERYNVEVVLWSKKKEETPLTKLYERLEDYLTIFGWEKSDLDFLETLENDGWKKIHEDEVSVIFKKSENPKN